MSPAAPPFAAIQPAALALCRVQGRDGRHDQDHRARLCGATASSRFAVAPGLHRVGDDRRISRRAAAARRSSPTSRSGRVASTDEVAEIIRWLAIDAPASATGSDDRRQRRQLCSLACSLVRRGRAVLPSSSRSASRARSNSRSRRSRRRARFGRDVQGLGRLGQACAAGPDPRQHLSRRDLRHLRDPDHRQRRPYPDRRRHRSRRRPRSRTTSAARLQPRPTSRYLLHSHEHFDHVGGMARLQQLTGAQLSPRPPRPRCSNTGAAGAGDPQAGMHQPFPAGAVDRIIAGRRGRAARQPEC